MPLFSVVQLFDGCRSRVRVPVQYACNRAGCVDRDGEGSTGPSRGEHRLTVYRAHASLGEVGHKNEDISESVCSIDSGTIFPDRLAQDLSRNVFVVWILLF